MHQALTLKPAWLQLSAAKATLLHIGISWELFKNTCKNSSQHVATWKCPCKVQPLFMTDKACNCSTYLQSVLEKGSTVCNLMLELIIQLPDQL